MHSIDYMLVRMRGLRRIARWFNQLRFSLHSRRESRRITSHLLDLRNFERRIHSQRSENGVLEEISPRIGTRNYGASLAALADLGREKGDALIACNRDGVNALFLLNDLLSQRFVSGSADYFCSCPKYSDLFFGHPRGKGPWMLGG